jgi:uncharacterized coiled-coil DUF342 family protein
MDEEEKKKLHAELEAKRQELNALKARLNELNSEKEAWFEKKRKASNAISGLAKSARDAKGKRNTFTKQVKDSKQRREELNKEFRDRLEELRKLQREKDAITRKFGIRVDPSKVQQEIEQLEFKIETEALPFSVEQRVMRQINEKKRVLEQSKEVSDVFDRYHRLRKEVDKVRSKADEAHKKIQSKAEISQQFHEELVESSAEIKALRAQEEEALKRFVELKTQFNAQNDLVKAKIDEMNSIRKKLGEMDFEEKKKSRNEEEKKIAEQERSVEEKIRKGIKITTDDLLIFQAREQMAEKRESEEKRRQKRGERREKPRREEQAQKPAQESSR